jgi:HAD superfamily hydrolase (TIGR01509 family)
MKNTNKILSVIFDMDGVIIDSNPLITTAWRGFLATHDIVLSDKQLNHYVFGRTASETVAMVFPEGLTPELISSYADEVAAEVQRLYISEGKIVPGFAGLVRHLASRQIPMAIATSAPAENVKIVLGLAGVGAYINIITDASQVHHSKPHPEVYLKTAERLGVVPADCCVFEDSFSGIQSAKSAGMNVIGITTTHSPQELLPLTDAVIADFTHITIDDIRALLAQKQ